MPNEPLGTQFNARSQLASSVPASGHRILGKHDSGVPSMVGVIRVSKTRDPNAWERHDRGDEVLVLLAGACTMTLRDAQGAVTEHRLVEGDVLLVPRGVAHSAMLHSDEIEALFVTPSTGSTEWSEGRAAKEVQP